MNDLSIDEVNALAVEALHLDPEAADLSTPEVLAQAIRRAAAVLCPCTARTLRQAVLSSLDLLSPEPLGEEIDRMLEALVAFGDLVETEMWDGDEPRRRELRLRYPSFLARHNGDALLIGVAPDGQAMLEPSLENLVEFDRHIRRLPCDETRDWSDILVDAGLQRVPEQRWLSEPVESSAEAVVRTADSLLEEAPPAGTLPEPRIIDPEQPPRYYKGRWRGLGHVSESVVIRWSQAYGADLWGYARVVDGTAARLLELPLPNSAFRAADDALRLLAAIDACSGRGPEVLVERSRTRGEILLSLFSPPPSWLQRRWDLLGEPVARRPRTLLSYSFRAGDAREEVEHVGKLLWMKPILRQEES